MSPYTDTLYDLKQKCMKKFGFKGSVDNCRFRYYNQYQDSKKEVIVGKDE